MTTLVIATRNAHKAAEIRASLADRFHYLKHRSAIFPPLPQRH